MTVWTIGHSTRSIEEFLELLALNQISRLVDVRSIPHSKRYPHFNTEALSRSLTESAISYTHLAELGGRRGKIAAVQPSPNSGWSKAPFRNYADYALTEPFQKGLESLLVIAEHERVAIMCSEAVWWRCHRRIITDHLVARGVEVMHILSNSAPERGTLTPFAEVTNERNVIYPPDQQKLAL